MIVLTGVKYFGKVVLNLIGPFTAAFAIVLNIRINLPDQFIGIRSRKCTLKLI